VTLQGVAMISTSRQLGLGPLRDVRGGGGLSGFEYIQLFNVGN